MKTYKKIIISMLIIFPYLILFYLLVWNNTNNITKNDLINKWENNFVNGWLWTWTIVEKKEENLYKQVLSQFKNIKDKDSFELFNKNSLHLMYLISLQKDKNVKDWDKYVSYLYKYDTKSINNLNTLEEFKKLADRYFNFENYSVDKLSLEDINQDMDIIFSSVDLQEGIDLCKKYFSDKLWWTSCIDHVTFLRAKKFNLYCDKISDVNKSKFCSDYFKFKDEI